MQYHLTLVLDFYQELGYLFLLSICTDKLVLALNIIVLLPIPPYNNEKVPHKSNETLYPK